MATFKELENRIDYAFQNDKKLVITANEIESLSLSSIEKLQTKINFYNLSLIESARIEGKIDDVSADYLSRIYSNPSHVMKDLVQKISHTIMKEYRPGKVQRLEKLNEEIGPEEINAIDLDSGKIEENENYIKEGLPQRKEYQIKHITPFTSMRLTFYDFRDNPIYGIIPGIKDVRRAIDKIKLPTYDENGNLITSGGKYYTQYQKDKKKIRAKYETQISAKYNQGSPEYEQELQRLQPVIQKEIENLPKPYQRLKDIFRLTICRKYYQDTEETLNLFAGDSQYAVSMEEVKDLFYGNQNISSFYGIKNYRDKKVYLNIDGIKMEMQIKISKLYEGDILTHEIYAGKEDAETKKDDVLLISHQNTKNNGTRFWEENKGRYLTEGDKKIVEMRILEKQMEAQRVNKQKIREANLQVLDKAFRLEDAKRANGKDFDAKSVNPINRKEQKIHRIVAKFIQDNFMYRPFKAFDMKQKFNVTDKELKSLGLVITKAQLDDLFNRYAEFILPKY